MWVSVAAATWRIHGERDGARGVFVCPCRSIMLGSGGTFRQQFETVSSHGIFVAPHGAGLMNILVMPPQSAIVEFFPYHLDHTLYSTMAALVGAGNYPVHGVDGTIIWQNDTVRRHCVVEQRNASVCRQCTSHWCVYCVGGVGVWHRRCTLRTAVTSGRAWRSTSPVVAAATL